MMIMINFSLSNDKNFIVISRYALSQAEDASISAVHRCLEGAARNAAFESISTSLMVGTEKDNRKQPVTQDETKSTELKQKSKNKGKKENKKEGQQHRANMPLFHPLGAQAEDPILSAMSFVQCRAVRFFIFVHPIIFLFFSFLFISPLLIKIYCDSIM